VTNLTKVNLDVPGPPVDALLAAYPVTDPKFFEDAFGAAFLPRLQQHVLNLLLGGPANYNAFLFPTHSSRCRYIVFVKVDPSQSPSLYDVVKAALLAVRIHNISSSDRIKTLLIQGYRFSRFSSEAFAHTPADSARSPWTSRRPGTWHCHTGSLVVDALHLSYLDDLGLRR
jgi:hypothetical protein